MSESWSDVYKFQNRPRRKKIRLYGREYFLHVLEMFHHIGFRYATPEMEKLWSSVPEDIIDYDWQEQTPDGLLYIGHHARDGDLDELIERLPSMREFRDFMQGNTIPQDGFNIWLMPVSDDKEYISFDFFFMPGCENTVLRRLRILKKKADEALEYYELTGQIPESAY